MATSFKLLSDGWNAEPNAPAEHAFVRGSDVVLEFGLNYLLYSQFSEDQRGHVVFSKAPRHRLGSTNDEGFYRGQCRFSSRVPEWGEFYEVITDRPLAECVPHWRSFASVGPPALRHFLFYFRDSTFECIAESWKFVPEAWRESSD